MSEEKQEDKKIVVDEDWKSQVAAEKEEQSKQQPTPEGDEAMAYPPASFLTLISTFATEAMVALGQFPRPGTSETVLNLQHAKFVIDTLDVLQQKTKGNLTGREADTLTTLLHQLRMVYVASSTGAAPAEEEPTGEGPSKIVTP